MSHRKSNARAWATAIATFWALQNCSGLQTAHGGTLVGDFTSDDIQWADVDAEPPRVVVLAIDGVLPADALAAGEDELPHLTALGRTGYVLGGDERPILASGPNFVSLPGYTEILSGSTPACQKNGCDERPSTTIVAEMGDAGSAPVAMLSSWESIAKIAPETAVVTAGRTGGGTRKWVDCDAATRALRIEGETSRPSPGHDDYRPDAVTRPLARSYFSCARPELMFVSLGDTDELAHGGDRKGYVAALHAADDLLGDLLEDARRLESEDRRPTVFFVTTDHGRADDFYDHGEAYPESARVWLVVGATSEPVLRRTRLADRDGPARLRDIAPTIRSLRGLPADTSPEAGRSLLAGPSRPESEQRSED
ncbi:MAG: hypothetical protein U0414_37735 [Polyangiaceae bacterium]